MNKISIDLDKLADGAVREKFNNALNEVTKNILDPNTKATAKRTITLKLTFEPGEDREIADVTVDYSTKLAQVKGVSTRFVIGTDGSDVIASEYKKQVPGQTVMKVEESEEASQEEKIDTSGLQLVK